MKLAEVQQMLQMLLREQVPIRQLGTILETLGEHASRTKDPVLLTEYVRHRLARTICSRYRDKESRLYVHDARSRAGRSHSRRHRAQRTRAVRFACRRRRSRATCQRIAEELRTTHGRAIIRRSCWSARRFAPA